MGFVALCTDRNALLVFPIVRNILVGVNLVAAFSRELLGPSGKVIERAMTLETDILVVAFALALLGVGVGLFSSPNTYAVMTSVDSRCYGVASATLSTMRQAGMVLSMGVATVVISSIVGDVPVESAPRDLFVSAMQTTLAICTFACLAGILASLARGAIHSHPVTVSSHPSD